MCYIALIKNISNTQGDNLKKVIADKLTYNDDGAFIGQLGNDYNVRTLDNKIAEAVVLGMPLDNLLVHFRMATTGEVNVHNVQGWTLNGWVCVHNGIVSKLSGEIKEVDSDSLKYFKLLTKQLGEERNVNLFKNAIRKVSYKNSFSGRAIVYNPVLDIALLFGDWQLYEYGGAILFSSASLWNLGQKTIKEHNGLVFEYSEGTPTGESELNGIFIMDNAKKANWTIERIGKLKEKKVNYNTSTSYYGYNYTPVTTLKPVIVPKQLPLPTVQDIEVVGYDLGGNDIILVDDELHTSNGSCCMAGKCSELWDYLDKEVKDNLIKNGVPYKAVYNPFAHWK